VNIPVLNKMLTSGSEPTTESPSCVEQLTDVLGPEMIVLPDMTVIADRRKSSRDRRGTARDRRANQIERRSTE